MSEENQRLARYWFEEVWNKGRAEVIDELFLPEGVAQGLNQQPSEMMQGPTAFRPFHRAFRGAFPDIHVTVEDAVAEGDKVVVRCTVRGTHTGEELGIAPTRKRVEFTGMCMLRFKGGKIAEDWNNFDSLTLYNQIGVLPSPAGLATP